MPAFAMERLDSIADEVEDLVPSGTTLIAAHRISTSASLDRERMKGKAIDRSHASAIMH